MSLCWESVLSKMLLCTELDGSVQVLSHVSAKSRQCCGVASSLATEQGNLAENETRVPAQTELMSSSSLLQKISCNL